MSKGYDMKNFEVFTFRRSAVALAVASAMGSVALPASADPLLSVKLFRDADIMFRDSDMSRYADNYVEIGGGYNSNDSFRFGQFSGLYEKGPFAVFGFNWLQHDPGRDSRYWSLFGSNLGLDSRRVRFEAGDQGLWNAYVGVDQLTKSDAENARFTFAGLGTNTLTQLCANVAATGTPSGAAAISPSCLQPFDIQQQRDIYRMGLRGSVAKDWDVKIDYREDRRDGTRLTGMYFNFGVIVPYHTNDKTQQVETLVAYTTKDWQWQFGYQFSKFSNNDPFLQVENPYTVTNGSDLGRLSLNPDNDFHQLHTTIGYNLSKQTRVTGQLSYGMARQNQTFMPYTTATGGAVTAGNVTPANASLDGEVLHTNADLALLTRPLDKLSLKLAYQYANKDNRTPVNTYTYFSRDANTAPAATNVRRNVPLSTKEHRFLADADYLIAQQTYLRAQLERRHVAYELADRTETDTDRASLELRRPVSETVLGSVGYTYTRRTGSDYYKNVFFENSYSSAVQNPTTASATTGFTNHPSMRQFLWSDYTENRVRASGNWTVSETVSLQGSVDGYRNRSSKDQNCSRISATQDNNTLAAVGSLPDTCLGRDELAGGSINLDIQWQPEENLTTFAFANVAVTSTDIHGRQYAGGTVGGFAPLGTTTAANTANDWFADVTMRDRAVGTGLKWQPVENWDVGGTYVFASSTNSMQLSRASGAAPAGIADQNSRLHTLQLFAKWDYSKAVTWRLNYVYELLHSDDFQLSNAPAAPGAGNSNILYIGQTPPRYINHVIAISAAIKTW